MTKRQKKGENTKICTKRQKRRKDKKSQKGKTQKDKNTKRKKDKRQRPKREFDTVTSGSFALLQCL